MGGPVTSEKVQRNECCGRPSKIKEKIMGRAFVKRENRQVSRYDMVRQSGC